MLLFKIYTCRILRVKLVQLVLINLAETGWKASTDIQIKIWYENVQKTDSDAIPGISSDDSFFYQHGHYSGVPEHVKFDRAYEYIKCR